MQRELYNAALEERIDCYRKTGKTRTYIDQCKALTECRHELPDMGELSVNLQRWTLKRLDDAFQGFFRRLKARWQGWLPPISRQGTMGNIRLC
jgi:putative transposase